MSLRWWTVLQGLYCGSLAIKGYLKRPHPKIPLRLKYSLKERLIDLLYDWKEHCKVLPGGHVSAPTLQGDWQGVKRNVDESILKQQIKDSLIKEFLAYGDMQNSGYLSGYLTKCAQHLATCSRCLDVAFENFTSDQWLREMFHKYPDLHKALECKLLRCTQ